MVVDDGEADHATSLARRPRRSNSMETLNRSDRVPDRCARPVTDESDVADPLEEVLVELEIGLAVFVTGPVDPVRRVLVERLVG